MIQVLMIRCGASAINAELDSPFTINLMHVLDTNVAFVELENKLLGDNNFHSSLRFQFERVDSLLTNRYFRYDRFTLVEFDSFVDAISEIDQDVLHLNATSNVGVVITRLYLAVRPKFMHIVDTERAALTMRESNAANGI